MEKTKVTICVGTTCYLLGAADLQDLENFLPDDLKENVEIIGSHCLGVCKDNQYGAAPFVKVDDEMMSNATVSSIIEKIYEHRNRNKIPPKYIDMDTFINSAKNNEEAKL